MLKYIRPKLIAKLMRHIVIRLIGGCRQHYRRLFILQKPSVVQIHDMCATGSFINIISYRIDEVHFQSAEIVCGSGYLDITSAAAAAFYYIAVLRRKP